MVLRREVKPGDWTSHWRATERGRHALDLLCGERGREEEGVVGGSWGALGPMPSFSLMAGERMEVKDENIATRLRRQRDSGINFCKRLEHFQCTIPKQPETNLKSSSVILSEFLHKLFQHDDRAIAEAVSKRSCLSVVFDRV